MLFSILMLILTGIGGACFIILGLDYLKKSVITGILSVILGNMCIFTSIIYIKEWF